MSYTGSEKKQTFKPKFEEKERVQRKLGYVFDQDKIDFRTQIPELPSKLKPKPNEQKHNEKVQQLQKRIGEIKLQRKSKKQQLKKGSQDYDKDILKLSGHVQLGKKCLIVLNYDLSNVSANLEEIQQKIQKKIRLVRNLQRGSKQAKQTNKTYQQMTYEELMVEEEKLSVKVSTANLSKKQESEINSLVSKLARLRLSAPHGEKPKDNTADILAAQESIQRLRNVKENLQGQRSDIQYKIECINEQLQEYEDEINDLEQQKKNPQNQSTSEECNQLKLKIYQLRDQAAKLQEQFKLKKKQYQEEQALIQWVKWATEVQNRKNQQWEAKRQERRRQRQKQKEKEKQKQKGVEGTKQNNDSQKKQEGKPERKKINKYQKQIDTCSFLISYCESLVKKQQKSVTQNEKQEAKNIESQLKSGEWSKMKGIQVVKSKKSNLDEELTKQDRNKKKKVQKTKQTQTTEAPVSFNHQFFTVHAFDSVKVVPPTKPEDVQGVLKDLNMKLDYFLEHPEGNESQRRVERTQKTQYVEKGSRTEKQKYAARGSKGGGKQKSVFNTTDFPSLS